MAHLSTLTAAASLGALLAGAVPALAQDQTVHIKDFAFAPARIEITAGTTVTFTNTDRAFHTATGTAGQFDTGTLEHGARAAVTFDTPGTYAYLCRFHRAMTGQIVVK